MFTKRWVSAPIRQARSAKPESSRKAPRSRFKAAFHRTEYSRSLPTRVRHIITTTLSPTTPRLGPSNVLYAGNALSNGTGNITVTTPDIPGASTFDLLRVSPIAGLVEQAPFGTGNFAVLTHVARSAACANGVCTFIDSQATPQAYNVAIASYFPLLDFWPGNLVLSSNQDTNSVLGGSRAFMDSAPGAWSRSRGHWRPL